jgi:hypothetical protein
MAIYVAMAIVILQKDLVQKIVQDPAPNLLIPLWTLVAYIAINFWKPKRNSDGRNNNASSVVENSESDTGTIVKIGGSKLKK